MTLKKHSLVLVLLLVSLFVFGCSEPENPSGPTEDPRIVTCTEDAKTCPDGTVLVRGGLACEFPACPGEETATEAASQ